MSQLASADKTLPDDGYPIWFTDSSARTEPRIAKEVGVANTPPQADNAINDTLKGKKLLDTFDTETKKILLFCRNPNCHSIMSFGTLYTRPVRSNLSLIT